MSDSIGQEGGSPTTKRYTCVIPDLYVILTGQSISCIIFMTEGHLKGQKVHFKVKWAKLPFSTNKTRNMCNTLFQRDIMFLPSQSWDIVRMLCPWTRHFILKYFTWLRWKWVSGRTEMFNAPKRLWDCMLSVEMRWHTNEQVQWPGGKNVQSDDSSSDLISDYKPAPLPFTSFLWNFDWVIPIWNYFDYSRSSSRSKCQFQGQVKENIIFNKQSYMS